MRKTHGFTLLELMITCVIIGLLAALAYPAYTHHVYTVKRTIAKAALLDYQSRMEKCYSNQFNYQTCGDALLPTALNLPNGAANQTYSLSLSAASSTTYTLQATAIGQQLNDTQCRTFTIDQTNSESAQDASNNDTTSLCW